MKTIHPFFALFIAVFMCATVNAQTCDPWITQAYKQLYNRVPNAEECKISNYNKGSWNNYNELVNYIKAYNAKKTAAVAPTLKGDPWIFKAYEEAYRRKPNAWELNVKNYNNGSWTSYADLKKYVLEFQASLQKAKLQLNTSAVSKNNDIYVIFEKDGKVVGIDLVSANGGQVVAAGGMNVIAAGGGNVIAPGGGNLQITAQMAGVAFGDKYRIQSAGSTVVPTSGKGALVFQ